MVNHGSYHYSFLVHKNHRRETASDAIIPPQHLKPFAPITARETRKSWKHSSIRQTVERGNIDEISMETSQCSQ